MAISVTTTGSQWKIAHGTEEEIVNYMMTSGLNTGHVLGYSTPVSGTATILYAKV